MPFAAGQKTIFSRILSSETHDKISHGNFGKKLSEEHKNKLRIAKIGKPSNALGTHWKIKNTSNMHHAAWNKGKGGKTTCVCGKIFDASPSKIKRGGKSCSMACRDMFGEKNGAWKGGVTTQNALIRKSKKYKEWREAVFKRDFHTCQLCGKYGGDMNADHIRPFALCPELRFVVDNGRTLCVVCHRKTDTYGYHKIYQS